MSKQVLEQVRAFVEANYEESGYYVYNVTANKIAWAKKGNRFCDHWEPLDEQDEALKVFVKGLFPQVVKMPKAKAPAKRVLKAAEPKAVKAGAWTVSGEVAKSPKGRAWRVTKSDEMGWFITSKAGLNGRLTKKGLWLQA